MTKAWEINITHYPNSMQYLIVQINFDNILNKFITVDFYWNSMQLHNYEVLSWEQKWSEYLSLSTLYPSQKYVV